VVRGSWSVPRRATVSRIGDAFATQRAERSQRRSAGVAERAGAAHRAATFLNLERETGFEPATSTLARSHSTTELFPPGQACSTETGQPTALRRNVDRTTASKNQARMPLNRVRCSPLVVRKPDRLVGGPQPGPIPDEHTTRRSRRLENQGPAKAGHYERTHQLTHSGTGTMARRSRRLKIGSG
jgi:hypothetical protein